MDRFVIENCQSCKAIFHIFLDALAVSANSLYCLYSLHSLVDFQAFLLPTAKFGNIKSCHCKVVGGTVRVTRLDPLADLESPCWPLLSSNTLALILGVLSGWNELMVV